MDIARFDGIRRAAVSTSPNIAQNRRRVYYPPHEAFREGKARYGMAPGSAADAWSLSRLGANLSESPSRNNHPCMLMERQDRKSPPWQASQPRGPLSNAI
ncbi:hypothetical protein GCM10027021_37860 [Dyella kyungheensis]